MRKIDLLTSENIVNYQPYANLFKNNNINICSPKKKCPCRTWINCDYYNDKEKQRRRIERKKCTLNIEEWYIIYFKFDINLHDLYCSG